MISNAKIRSLKFDSDCGVHANEGDSTACRSHFPSKTTGSARSEENADFRGKRGCRGGGRGHGRGRGVSESYAKTRIFVESKNQETNRNALETIQDCRISKILRKLSRENDPDKFMTMTKQLQEVLLLPENSVYLRHSLDFVSESLLDLFHSGPSAAARNDAARCLGRTGYALQGDFLRFLNWLFGRFAGERNTEVRALLMKSLHEVIALEMERPVLAHFAPGLMLELKMALETVDLPELLIGCVDVVLALIGIYPDCLKPYFRDIIDILVGWGLMLKEQGSLNYVLRSLHQLQVYWLADLPFAMSLLSQFFEDFEVEVKKLEGEVSAEDASKDAPNLVSLLRIFSSVATCLPSTYLSPAAGLQGPSLAKILDIMGKTLLLSPSDDLVVAANICAGILLPQFNDLLPASILTILEYISTLMTVLPHLGDNAVVSVLQFITKVANELGPGLPADLPSSLLGQGAPLASLKNSPNPEIDESLAQLYRGFLRQPLLFQQVLWLVQTDTDPAVAVLISPDDGISVETLNSATMMLSFHLQVMSELVFALEPAPGTLDILLQWRPESKQLASRCPPLHYALLALTHAHCLRFRHFVTAESNYHFLALVTLLTRLLEQRLAIETVLFLLGWTRELLLECQPFLPVLLHMDYFLPLIEAVLECERYKYSEEVLLIVGSCLELLVGFYNNFPKPELAKRLIEICCHQLNATNSEVAAVFSGLLPCLPLEQTLGLISNDGDSLSRTRVALLRSHVTRSTHSFLSARNFKILMNYLLHGEENPDCNDWLQEIFLESYPLGLQNGSASGLVLKQTARQSRSLLLPLICFEAAQMCVMNKLRTSLGKPPETFTAFETALKAIAKDVAAVDGKSMAMITRSRVFVEFMEWLEKTIYNAAEGSAATLPSVPKNVRTFFHANKNTCSNWLTRLRLVMGIVGIKAGLPAFTVRNTYALLAELSNTRNTQGSEYESAVLYCTWALLTLGDAEAITGLYVWCQKEADRKFVWLLPVAHHAAHKFELAIEGYKELITNEWQKCVDDGEHAKNLSANLIIRFVFDCLLDCYRRVEDFNNLETWLEKKKIILAEGSNGVHAERFLDPPWSQDDATFLTSVQEILTNRSSKYRWRARNDEDGIKELDHSILDAKISSSLNVRCKKALNRLADWSQIAKNGEPVSTYWRMESVTESLKQGLFNDAVFIHIGGSLEKKAFVLQMSDNEIEIDLNVNQLMEQWGASYDFELSNFLKEVKESYAKDKEDALLRVQTISRAVEELLRERLRCGRATPARDLLIVSAVCRDILQDGHAIRDVNLCDKKLPSDLVLHLAFWKRLLHEDDLKLDVLKSARKEGNLDLARRSLLWHFKGKVDKDLVEVCDELVENFDRNMNPVEGELCVQVAKLLYGFGSVDSAMDFASLTALKLIRPDNREEVRQCGSRLLLTLAKWLQRIPGNETPTAVGNLIQIPDAVLDNVLIMPYDSINNQKIITDRDMAIGRVLSMSVAHCPRLGKTWSQYASWCYKWGRKMTEAAARDDAPLDVTRIREILPESVCDAELDQIVGILRLSSLDDDTMQNESLSTLDLIKTQLQCVPGLEDLNADSFTALIDVWRDCQARVSSAYHKAAQAYFKYLHLCADNEMDTRTLTATLRILRLLVKHAVELQELLEEELPTTPPLPWQGIIPQLFSRLNHPEGYVRARLAELLCRIAQTTPNLIIFHAVVGSSAGANRIADLNSSTSKLLLSQNSDDDADDDVEEDDYEVSASDSQCSVLTNCYKAMVDTLSKQMPEAISQVQRFVSELRRITLLWDELWLGTLNQHHGEVTRRLCQLEQEVRKVDNNPALSAEEKPLLIAEKHRIIMKPVVFVLEQLQAITSVAPETPHEIWFQEKLGDAINTALDKLRNPADARNPTASWLSFRAIHAKLQKRAQKRACTTLKMESISPVLFEMKETAIPMPGVSGPPITIAGVNNAVLVLPTKTKPKKLVFFSNKATTHTYLFKGLEDLHLDERIMQFLAIANTMLGNRGSSDYRARHYSVTPLGPRSGLISWVDRVTPLFTLYKKWQQRDSANKQQSFSNSGQVALRPSEMYYNKLTPLLKEAGVSLERRKDWPLPLLKQVLQELMKETPSDLLAKELWCNSFHVDEWWETTKRYTRSVAVMSVIGYIIGLGDRHLDNVLIDLHTGEMVHIDYNVCFEKGKTLRVPEKVPFRMTQNIREALGVTGVEGHFHLACEHVLKVLKQGRETLLPLLEAFVYDPLIDWTPGSETGYTGAVYGGGESVKETRQNRKALEREVTRAMFVVRVAEMKAEWFDNKEKVLTVLAEVCVPLETYLVMSREAQTVEDKLADAHQQMLVVKEAEAAGAHHPLYSLASRCCLLLKARSTFNALVGTLRDKRDEYERETVHYQNALKEITGESLTQWIEHLNNPLQPDSLLMFDLVKQFLQTAGQSGMVTQCDQAEAEIGQLDTKQRQLMRNCTDLLAEYAALIALYPNQPETHRAYKFQHWLHRLLTNATVDDCRAIACEFDEQFGASRPALGVLGKQAVVYAAAVHQAVLDARSQLKRAMDRAKIDPDHTRSFEDARNRLRELARSDKKAGPAVELAVILHLCRLNHRFLELCTGAKAADEAAEAVRVKDGQTLLEEMCMINGLMTEFMGFLPSSGNEQLDIAVTLNTLNKTYAIFKELLELLVNFHSIILPEALKCATTQHPDMVAMVRDLQETAAGVDFSLDDLKKQLKFQIDGLGSHLTSKNSDIQHAVGKLRADLEVLLQRPCLDAGQSPGQMLLMGFHGMFEKLCVEVRHMISLVAQFNIQPAWRKLDQISEAEALTAPILDNKTRSAIEDLFLIRRLQTMLEFFGLCEASGAAFRGSGSPVVFGDDRLNKPIRCFAAEFVGRIMLGVPSQSLAVAVCLLLKRLGFNLNDELEKTDGQVTLDEICRRAMESLVQKGVTTKHLKSEAASIVATITARYRDQERGKLLMDAVEMRERALTRLEALLTAHNWYHEDVLLPVQTASLAVPPRAVFMTKLCKASTALMALQTRVAEARESQRALVASVEQRLRWAGGANPALVEVLAAFATGISALDHRFDADAALASRLGAVCAAILRHEVLRTRTTEALNHDDCFMKILEQCTEIAKWREESLQQVSPVEENLLQLMTPESAADANHLEKLEMKISENIEKLKTRRASLAEKMASVRVDCETEMEKLKALLGNHHALMTEVRHPLRTMAKFEDLSGMGIGDYLERYREFSENIQTVVGLLATDSALSIPDIEHALLVLNALPEKIVAIYEDLVAFADKSREGKKRPPLLRQESVCSSPKHLSCAPTPPHRSGKAYQERNAYALNVWRRIQQKLEGKDPDPGRRLTPHEQVDYIIREATSLDNLALLYEGWTPWV